MDNGIPYTLPDPFSDFLISNVSIPNNTTGVNTIWIHPEIEWAPETFRIRDQATAYSCSCAECWDTVSSEESIDWLSVGLNDCPPTFNETTLRKKLASWINEECGAALDCNLPDGLQKENILIGEFTCDAANKEFRIVVLKNSTGKISNDNLMTASTVGLVIQSREHLLSFMLHSEIHSVTVYRRFAGSSSRDKSATRLSLILFTSAFIIFLILLGVIVYFSQIYVNWRRIVKGKWDTKQYTKVPNVRYSLDEIESSGHI